MKCFAVLVMGLFVAGSFTTAYATPTTNGLYAVFATTKGTFYCYLRYDLAPRTVANFVSLADGTKDWIDYPNAAVVKRPFYNGLTFHRVATNFVIQGGSPNGIGTDDPGYTFRNEVTNALTHNKPGILAMANRGDTNSNGSQFYVTLAAEPFLNGNYSIFGAVVEGMNVVSNINKVATDASEKPLVPILMTNVSILRIGTAASNFNAQAVSPALPVPKAKAARIYQTGPNYWISWPPLAGYEYRICYSSNMRHWDWQYFGTTPPAGINDWLYYFSYQFFITFESKID